MNSIICWLTGGHDWIDQSDTTTEGDGGQWVMSVTVEYHECLNCGKVKF